MCFGCLETPEKILKQCINNQIACKAFDFDKIFFQEMEKAATNLAFSTQQQRQALLRWRRAAAAYQIGSESNFRLLSPHNKTPVA